MTTTQETKPKSYTQRLKEFLEEKKVSKKTLDFISEFALEESERREQEKEATKHVMTWGKYKNKNIEEVYKLDATYIKWALKNSQYLTEPQKELMNSLINSE